MKRTAAVALVAGIALALLGVAPAVADTGDEVPDPQIAAMMDEVPGGVLIDSHHAVWPELEMEMTVPDTRAGSFTAMAAVGACESGRVCVFTGYSLAGATLSWGTCGYHAIPSSFSARSVADARSTGKAQARSGTSVLATAAAGGWANIYGTANNVLCYF